MEHMFLRNFDKDGNWTKPSRDIRVWDAKQKAYLTVNMDEYAKQHGITLPDAKTVKKHKPAINIEQVADEHYADMEQTFDSGHSEESGDGDSEGSE